jgi:CMP-N-acetylneuraminic acid synthetase
MSNPQITIYIPLKDHSQRIPGKNFKLFLGQPLFQWVINTCLSLSNIREIVINTDSLQLKKMLPKSTQIRIINRLSNLVGDDVSVNEIISSDLSSISTEHILQTHVTNPLVSSETFNRAITTYFTKINQDYDSLFSVTPHHKRFYFQAHPVNHNPQMLLPTQDLDPVMEENSNLYLFSKQSFKQSHHLRIGHHPWYYLMNTIESIDIDTIEEFHLAEYFAKQIHK